MSTSNGNKQQQSQEFSEAATGVTQQIPATVTVNVGGQPYTAAQLVSVFNAAVTAIKTVTATRATLQQQVANQSATIQTAHTLYLELKKYAEVQFGKGSPVLAAFGFSSAPPTQKSSETKTIAAAKAKLTRQARGTKGSRQKLAVTTSGAPGLVLVGANGQVIPGATQGPIAPATPPSNSGSNSSK
jgi:hypothetical protein